MVNIEEESFLKYVTFLVRIIFIFFLIAVISWGVAYGWTLHMRRDAYALLSYMRSFNVGESTTSDVLLALKPFRSLPNLPSMNCETFYNVQVSNFVLNRITYNSPLLRRVGLVPWGVRGAVSFQKGKLCASIFSVETTLDEQRRLTVSARGVASNTQMLMNDHPDYEVFPLASNDHFHRLDVRFTPRATSEEREHAFDFDLSCLTRSGGCGSECELMPSAWLDYEKTARSKGWTLRPNEVNDPHCKERPAS
jgi:hypothetical protein